MAAIQLNEALNTIKHVGTHNVRIVPMDGQSIQGGDHKIEVRETGTWSTVVEGISKKMAEDLVSQATNRVICG